MSFIITKKISLQCHDSRPHNNVMVTLWFQCYQINQIKLTGFYTYLMLSLYGDAPLYCWVIQLVLDAVWNQLLGLYAGF